MVCKYFLLFCKLLLSCFFFLLRSWWCPESTKVFKFWWCPNSVAWAFGVTFKKASPYPRSQRVYSCFFFLPKSLSILAVTFRPAIHFELILIESIREESSLIFFACGCTVLSSPYSFSCLEIIICISNLTIMLECCSILVLFIIVDILIFFALFLLTHKLDIVM